MIVVSIHSRATALMSITEKAAAAAIPTTILNDDDYDNNNNDYNFNEDVLDDVVDDDNDVKTAKTPLIIIIMVGNLICSLMSSRTRSTLRFTTAPMTNLNLSLILENDRIQFLVACISVVNKFIDHFLPTKSGKLKQIFTLRTQPPRTSCLSPGGFVTYSLLLEITS